MLVMAKKKRSTPKRYGANMTIWVEPAIKAALLKFVDHHTPRTTLTGIAEVAFKHFLEEHGFWPPKKD